MKIISRLAALAAALLLIALLLPLTGAASILWDDPTVQDRAGLLTASQADALTDELDKLSVKYDCRLMVVTESSVPGGDYRTYAWNLAERLAKSVDNNGSLILLFVDMEKDTDYDRGYAIEAIGKGQSAVLKDNERGYDLIEDTVKSKLSDENFYGAFKAFAKTSGQTLDAYVNNKRLRANYPFFFALVATVVVALIAGAIHTGKLKRQLKSVEMQTKAANYMRRDSMKVTLSNDIFLYSTVSKTPRQTNSGSSGRGGHSTFSSGGHSSRGGGF